MAVLYPTDTAATSENTAFSVGKGLSDTSTVTPLIEFEFRKGIDEGAGIDAGAFYFEEDYVEGAPIEQTYTLGLQLVRDIGKPLADSTTVLSLTAILSSYGRSDSYVASDADLLFFNKGVTEIPVLGQHIVDLATTKALSDGGGFGGDSQYFAEDYVTGAPNSQTYTIGVQISRAVGKGVADSIAAASLAVMSMQFGRVLSDAYASGDSLFRTFNKVLGHGVGATDDLNGALPLDDQTIAFFKSLGHIVSTGDAPAKVFQRSLFETPRVLDTPAKQSGKSLLEVSVATEMRAQAVGKVLSDLPRTTDISAKALQRSLSDGAATADSGVRAFGSVRSDSFSVSDSMVYQFAVAKAAADIAVARDARALTNTKILGHTARAAEVSTRLAGKVSSDSAGADSSGALLAQGYTVDMTYFAEDYVGASRTF
jgi:hypothetical protein